MSRDNGRKRVKPRHISRADACRYLSRKWRKTIRRGNLGNYIRQGRLKSVLVLGSPVLLRAEVEGMERPRVGRPRKAKP